MPFPDSFSIYICSQNLICSGRLASDLQVRNPVRFPHRSRRTVISTFFSYDRLHFSCLCCLKASDKYIDSGQCESASRGGLYRSKRNSVIFRTLHEIAQCGSLIRFWIARTTPSWTRSPNLDRAC